MIFYDCVLSKKYSFRKKRRKRRKKKRESGRKSAPKSWPNSINLKTPLDPTLSFQNELEAAAAER